MTGRGAHKEGHKDACGLCDPVILALQEPFFQHSHEIINMLCARLHSPLHCQMWALSMDHTGKAFEKYADLLGRSYSVHDAVILC